MKRQEDFACGRSGEKRRRTSLACTHRLRAQQVAKRKRPGLTGHFTQLLIGLCLVGLIIRCIILAENRTPLALQPVTDALSLLGVGGRHCGRQSGSGSSVLSAPLYPYLLGRYTVAGGTNDISLCTANAGRPGGSGFTWRQSAAGASGRAWRCWLRGCTWRCSNRRRPCCGYWPAHYI